MASVAAATCADANAAATAAIVAGAQAEDWLAAAGLPARLAGQDGRIRRIGGWPGADGEPVPVPAERTSTAGRLLSRRAPMSAAAGGSQASCGWSRGPAGWRCWAR